MPNPYDNPFWGKPPPEPKPNRWLWVTAVLFCIGVYVWIAQYLGG